MRVRSLGWKGALALACATALGGCVSVGKMDVSHSRVVIGDQKSLSVAIVIGAESWAVAHAYTAPNACFSSGVIEAPVGRVFANTVADRFRRVFKRVSILPTAAQAFGYDAIFVARLVAVYYRNGCLLDPRTDTTVFGKLIAKAPDGREIWRSATERSDTKIGSFGISTDLGTRFSNQIGMLVDIWAQEVIQAPVARYTSAVPAEPGR